MTVLVDGHTVAQIEPGGAFSVRIGEERTMLGVLPESTFFRRYRETFGA
jgi:hypothetical protein